MKSAQPNHTPGRRGLRLSRQLLLWVLLPQVVLWLAGGAAAYRMAASYVEQTLDSGLLQSSRALARQLKPMGSGLLVDFPRAAQAILEADPSDRKIYMVSSPPGAFVLGNQRLPPPPPEWVRDAQPGQAFFYDGQMVLDPLGSEGAPYQRVRVVALYLTLDAESSARAQPVLVQVARSNTMHQQLAQRILVDMLLPLSTLMLLMTLIVWLGIRAGLAPLKRLTQQVEGRSASNLQPLHLDSAPQELHALAVALNALLAQAQQHLERQQRFIDDAAHQLRTPLAGLKSQVELALEQCHDPALQQRLSWVHQSASRSAHLVAQMLTLARSEPENGVNRTERHDLRLLAQRAVADWVPRALKAQIDLGWSEDAEPPCWVQVNAALLLEAVGNLIDNALRYAGANSEVTVGVERQGQQATLWVRDNGAGIAPDKRARVFERFFRATDQGTGSGLGMAIVHNILASHGGSVQLLHPEAGGLEVRLNLPTEPLEVPPHK